MGSGCTTSALGASGILKPTPDTSVIYTGPAIPALNICTGDTLDEIEAIILGKIIDFSTGIGIHIPDIDLTACDLFKQHVTCCGKGCDDLDCLMKIIFESLCILYTDYTDLKTLVDSLLNGPYNTGCLDPIKLGTNPTLKSIVQELILEFCALKAAVAALQTQVNNLATGLPTAIGNFLQSALSSCQTDGFKATGTGSTFKVAFAGFGPVGTIVMYGGDLSVFDSTGMGKNPGPACGWALCNGNTHGSVTTVDFRGFFPAGVNDGTMGGGAPAAPIVNNSIYPGSNYSYNSFGGLPTVALTGSMCSIPSHTHPVIDPGHSHVMHFSGDTFSGSKFSNMVKFDGNNLSTTLDGTPDIGNIHIKIMNNTTGISIGPSSGGGSGTGAPHENRPPYRAVYFIQRIF